MTKLSRIIDVGWRRSRPGTILIFVVTLLVLLALVGTAYVATARVDRYSAAQTSASAQIDLLVQGVANQAFSTIVNGVVDPRAATANPLTGSYRPISNNTAVGGGAYNSATSGTYNYSYVPYDSFQVDPNLANIGDPAVGDTWLAQRTPEPIAANSALDNPGYDSTNSTSPVWQALTYLPFALANGSTTTWNFYEPLPQNTNDGVNALIQTPGGGSPFTLSPQKQVFMPTYIPYNGQIYPALELVVNGQPQGSNYTYMAADADGDGIADSFFYKLPGGTLGGLTYYAAVRIIDASSAVNVNTAYGSDAEQSFFWGNAWSNVFPCGSVRWAGVWPASVGLSRIIVDHTDSSAEAPYGAIGGIENYGYNSLAFADAYVPCGGEFMELNKIRFPNTLGPCTYATPYITDPYNPVNNTSVYQYEYNWTLFQQSYGNYNSIATNTPISWPIDDATGLMRPDFRYLTTGEAMWNQYGRRLDFPGYASCYVPTASTVQPAQFNRPFNFTDGTSLASRFVLKASDFGSTALEQALPVSLLGWGVQFQPEFVSPNDTYYPYAPTVQAVPFAASAAAQWFASNFNFPYGPSLQTMPLRSVLVTRNPESNAVSAHLAVAGTSAPYLPSRIASTTGVASNGTLAMLAYSTLGTTNVPHKAGLNTASLSELWRGFWNVMCYDADPTKLWPYDDPASTGNPALTYPAMPTGFATSDANLRAQRGIFRNSTRGVGSVTFDTAWPEKLFLRSALAAVNATHERFQSHWLYQPDPIALPQYDPVHNPGQTVGAPAIINLSFDNVNPSPTTVWGVDVQPFITEVYVNLDTAAETVSGDATQPKNSKGYFAIELFNPYPFPIMIDKCRLVGIPRPQITSGSTPQSLPLGYAGLPNISLAGLTSNATNTGMAATVIPPRGYLVLENYKASGSGVGTGDAQYRPNWGGCMGNASSLPMEGYANVQALPFSGMPYETGGYNENTSTRPAVNFAYVPGLDQFVQPYSAFVYNGVSYPAGTGGMEMVLVRPNEAQWVLTCTTFSANGNAMRSLEYVDAEPGGTALANMAPLDQYDFTGLAFTSSSPYPCEHYARMSGSIYWWYECGYGKGNPGTVLKDWMCVYPGQYHPTTAGSAAGDLRYDGTQRSSMVALSGIGPVFAAGTTTNLSTLQLPLFTGVAVQLGRPVLINQITYVPQGGWTSPQPLQLVNIDQAGPNRINEYGVNGFLLDEVGAYEGNSIPSWMLGFVGANDANDWNGSAVYNPSPNPPLSYGPRQYFPYGAFARVGNIMAVPFVGAYRVNDSSGNIWEYNSVTMDVAFADDGDPTNFSPPTSTSQSYSPEYVGHFLPVGDPINPVGTVAVPTGDFAAPAIGANEFTGNSPYRYKWATRVLDYFTVLQNPADDNLPDISPSLWGYYPPNTTSFVSVASLFTAVNPPYPWNQFASATGTAYTPTNADTAPVAVTPVANSNPLSANNGTEDNIGSDGRVNINTAPWKVLAMVPWLPDPYANGTSGDVNIQQPGPTYYSTLANPGPPRWPYGPGWLVVPAATLAAYNYPTAQAFDYNDAVAMNIVAYRNKYGPFKSVFDLEKVYDVISVQNGDPTGFNRTIQNAWGTLPIYFGSPTWPILPDWHWGDFMDDGGNTRPCNQGVGGYVENCVPYAPTGNINTSTAGNNDQTGASNLVEGDWQTKFLIMNRETNIVTTRSDTFTVYIDVQGWSNGGTASGQLVVERRAAFIVDRSGVTPQMRTPRVYQVRTDH